MPRLTPARTGTAFEHTMTSRMTPSKQEILLKAAECFMEQGFHATSIDDVARRLGATKGRIYHHYPSKIELFFDVHREGMARLFEAVEPARQTEGDGVSVLAAMLRGLGATVSAVRAPFEPEGGAYSGGHHAHAPEAKHRGIIHDFIEKTTR